jgi:hypothetical protein
MVESLDTKLGARADREDVRLVVAHTGRGECAEGRGELPEERRRRVGESECSSRERGSAPIMGQRGRGTDRYGGRSS